MPESTTHDSTEVHSADQQRTASDILKEFGEAAAAGAGVSETGKITPTLRSGKERLEKLIDVETLYQRARREAKRRADEEEQGKRTLRFRRASDIEMRPVRWLWQGRIPLGTLGLVGGREGIGKSTLVYQIIAHITRGQLPGKFFGASKNVIVAATEDSWEFTIVPRLRAAGADLTRVIPVDVETAEGLTMGLQLVEDLPALERQIVAEDVALVVFDPLISRLGKKDTHKDAEVRQALEPLCALADRTGAAVLGLIHVNKSTSTDPLTLIMGSRAFAALARWVLFVMLDPEDEQTRLLAARGESK